MSYDYSFTNKSVVLIVAGCLTIGILLFVAGFIVGLDHGAAREQPKKEAAHQPGKSDAEKPGSEITAKPEPQNQAVATKDPVTAPAEAAKEPAKQQPVAATAPPSDPGPGPDAANEFAIQIGAFESQENAVALRDRVKSKGYSAFVFDAPDGGGHVWHAVRMGHFKKLEDATRAAVAFTRKERIPAFVRPGNEL
jgi:cell division septation protein DedD